MNNVINICQNNIYPLNIPISGKYIPVYISFFSKDLLNNYFNVLICLIIFGEIHKKCNFLCLNNTRQIEIAPFKVKHYYYFNA